MSNRVKIVYLDGTEAEAVAGARAEVEVERRFNVAFADAFSSASKTPRSEHLYVLGWAALRYSGAGLDAEFDDWLERVQDVDVIDAEAKSDPTRPARRSAKSSS